jgi:transposase
VRATTLLNQLLNLPGTAAVDPGSWQVGPGSGVVRVRLCLTRRLLVCPHCEFLSWHRYDTREVDSAWRHLDLGGRVCRVGVRRRRLRCPEHGVVAEGVPFARVGAGFTQDFEQMVAWLVTKADKKAFLPPGVFSYYSDFSSGQRRVEHEPKPAGDCNSGGS